MSISVLITLTTGTGGNTGPTFNLFSDADGYATAFETGVTKTSLLAGYTSSVVPNSSTIIRCKSTGTCTNYSDFTISGAPVPSPTPTPTPTSGPVVSYNYYSVTRYNCPSCNSPVTGLFARTTSPTSLTNTYYYNNGDGYVYLVNFGTAGPSYTIDLDGSASSGTNCSGTCGI